MVIGRGVQGLFRDKAEGVGFRAVGFRSGFWATHPEADADLKRFLVFLVDSGVSEWDLYWLLCCTYQLLMTLYTS